MPDGFAIKHAETIIVLCKC